MWLKAAGYSYLGIFFGVALVVGYLMGAWADRRFHTTPWLALGGVLLGIAASFKELYRLTVQYRKEQAGPAVQEDQKGPPR